MRSASLPLGNARERAISEVRRIVLEVLGSHRAEILLVGSSARGALLRRSDIDVAIDPIDPIPEHVFSQVRNALDESEVPYRVDVFDLSRLDEQYRTSLMAGAIRWTP